MPHQNKEGVSYLQQGGTSNSPYSITFLIGYIYMSGMWFGVDQEHASNGHVFKRD